MTPWHATGVPLATWSVTVPVPRRNHRRWVVVILALQTEDRSNPGGQAQNVDEDVGGKSVSEASTFYTVRTGINIPWTMQDN